MTNKQITESINKAIDNMKTMRLTIKSGIGGIIEIDFDPYIYGSDIMQYEFLWGYMPKSKLFYKMRVDSIVEAKTTNDNFIMQNDTLYLFAIEEEHWNHIKPILEKPVKIYSEGLVERKVE